MNSVSRLTRMRPALAAGTAALAGFLAGASMAQAQPAAIDYSDVEASPALWRVSDADSDVYIFGTFHILPDTLDWQTDAVMEAVDSAQTLYLEADVHSPEAQAQMQALIPQYGLNPQGVTLSSMLDDETRALLAEVAPTVGAAPAALDPLRPWLAQLMLSVAKIQQMGFNPAAGTEMQLIARVSGTDTEFGYFETAAEQIGFLAGIPEEVQVRGFAETLHELEDLPQEVDDMVRAWATGDVEVLDEYVNGDMREDEPEVYEAVIVQRNRNWIPQIEAILEGEGTVFIAVGAGHLPGDEGVIELLRHEGYEVVRQ